MKNTKTVLRFPFSEGESIIWQGRNSLTLREKLFSLFLSGSKKESYCVTDKNIYILHKGRCDIKPLEEISRMTLVKKSDTSGSLYFGDENSDFVFRDIDAYVSVYKLVSDEIRKIRQKNARED